MATLHTRPRAQSRSLSSSTTNTAYSGTQSHTSRASSHTSPDHSTGSSPSKTQPALPVRSTSIIPNSPKVEATPIGSFEGADELDRYGYLYSLRVAALHQRLAAPPPPPPFGSPPTSPFLAQRPGDFRLSTMPAVPGATMKNRISVASTASRATVVSTGPAVATDEKTVKRKKSALRLLGSKRDTELKLPKEVLAELWKELGTEGGDTGWLQAVRNFLILMKKGYKTPQGSCREVRCLVDTFMTCLPAPGPHCAPVKEHYMHILTFVHNILPELAYFANSSSNKDRDLLHKLRGEIQGLIDSPPFSTTPLSPPLAQHGFASAPVPAAAAPSVRNSTAESITSRPENRNRRKPTPTLTKADLVDNLGGLVEAVGAVWGVPRDILQRDLAECGKGGQLERHYLEDIKLDLSTLSKTPDTLATKERQARLRLTVAELMGNFPELTIPTSPVAYAVSGQRDHVSFFAPPRKKAVFMRFSRRISKSSVPRSEEVLEKCQAAWSVPTLEDMEDNVKVLIRRWEEVFRAGDEEEEMARARQLADGMADLIASVHPSMPLPPLFDDLHRQLMSALGDALQRMFPTTLSKPPKPPASLPFLLNAAPDHFINSAEAKRRLQSIGGDLTVAAMAEFVQVAADNMGGVNSASAGIYSPIEGLEHVAQWMDMEIGNIRSVWGDGFGELNAAGVVLAAQLPQYIAELMNLEAGGPSSKMFGLYDWTYKLLGRRDALCPGSTAFFDLDEFFEPHVRAWLRETETSEVDSWVTRTIGMDNWRPVEGGCSNSVIDLFGLIRRRATVLEQLPMTKYRRALSFVDFAKTSSIAATKYASTVQELYMRELGPSTAPTTSTPVEVTGRFSKANTLLSKSRHALQKLDQKVDKVQRRRSAGYVVSASACVKLTNLGVAQAEVESLKGLFEAEDSATVLRKHSNLANGDNSGTGTGRSVFSITILRGQNILTSSGSGKPADSFVTITDRLSGERLFKSRTVLEKEDPMWDQSFEVTVGKLKRLDLAAMDRQLLGKHDLIGNRSFNIDPNSFVDTPERDMVLPLAPRGLVHIRVSTEGHERHDVSYHLQKAQRYIERVAGDMMREMVDRVCDLVRSELSYNAVNHLAKAAKKNKTGDIDANVDEFLYPTLDHLQRNLSVMSDVFSVQQRNFISLTIWDRIVDILINIVVPPLSDRPGSRSSTLVPTELDIVFRCLQMLQDFFHENGDGVPLQDLHAGAFKDIMLINQFLHIPTAQLRDHASAAVRAACSATETHDPQDLAEKERVAEIWLRMCRTRIDNDGFLTQHVAALVRGKVERQKDLM